MQLKSLFGIKYLSFRSTYVSSRHIRLSVVGIYFQIHIILPLECNNPLLAFGLVSCYPLLHEARIFHVHIRWQNHPK